VDALAVVDSRWRGPAHRVTTVLAAFSLFAASFATWQTVVQVPVTGVISVTGFAAELVLVVAALVLPVDRLRHVDLALMLIGLLVLTGWALFAIYMQPGYGTDEAAFVQYGASALLHGHNPYQANLTPALSEFRVPVQYATYLLGGGIVHSLGYPALPVLVTALFIPLTGGVQSVIIADVLALGATCVVTYFLLPRTWRAMAVLLTVGLPIMFGYSVSGVTAVLMGLPLVVVAWRWTETGLTTVAYPAHGHRTEAGRLGRAGTARAICLGLAVATQQIAWFIAPFVLIGLWRLRREDVGRRQACRVLRRFLGWTAATFMAVNLPFILWAPGAWLSGTFSPVLQHAIPYGQGFIDAAMFFNLGGGALVFYTITGVLVYVGILIAYTARFDQLGRACFVLPVLALFFTTRSLAEYFMTLIVVWTVSLLTTNWELFKHVPRLWCGQRPRLRLLALFVPALAAATVALAVPSPLRLSVLSVRTNGELEGVWRFEVSVTNTSSYGLRPQFQANYMGQPTTFFDRLNGPATLAPGQHAVYTLAAPNRGSMPGIMTPFVVVATTAHPETISVSRRFIPQPYSADLEPGYVDQIIASDGSTTFQVYLRSPFGRLVYKAGVRVALGQIIYGQEALIDAQASINGQPEGRTPVDAYTNSQGVATFHISDPQPQDQPIYFQAWIDSSYPYGYSDIVPVLWHN
jgi:hypothetical protein